MTDKSAYLQNLEAQLDAWDAEVQKLQAKAKDAQADARLNYAEQLNLLQARRREVAERMEELRNAGEDAWEDVRVGVDAAWSSLNNALDKAQQRFR